MNARKLLALVLIVGLLVPAAAAAPLAGPCNPGVVYDPACDTDQDGDVDIFDIQLTAGHWNQTGTFVSDSNHTHLGQTWTGSNNPLIVTGSFAGNTSTSGAPLILSNTGGDGLRIQQAGTPPGTANDAGSNGVEIAGAQGDGLHVAQSGRHGVYVSQAGAPTGGSIISGIPNGFEVGRAEGHGLFVGNANHNGVRVYQAGLNGFNVRAASDNGVLIESVGMPSALTGSASADGVEIQGVQGNGLFIGQADADGVHIRQAGTPTAIGGTSTGANGVEIVNVQGHGIFVSRTDVDGLRINLAGDDGLEVDGNDFAGVFASPINVTGGCTGCDLATFAVNAGDQVLQPGDVVAIQGMVSGSFDNAPRLLQVIPARPGLPIVGVVAGYAEIDTEVEPREDTSGVRLVPRTGAAQPGAYLSVIYNGIAQVRAGTDAVITVGQKLTVDGAGHLRARQQVEINGVALAQDAPVLGIALGPVEDGLVWVLVNP